MEEEASEFLHPSSTPPKLTLNSYTTFPRRTGCLGMATPPLRLAGAIPFKWEEAPGRPIQKPNRQSSASATADADKHLGLPPRLSASAATKEERGGAKILSHTTVINGPCFFIRKPLYLTFVGKKRKWKKVRWDVSSEKSSTTEDTSISSSSFNSSSIGSVSSSWNGEGGSEDGESEEVVSEELKEEERMVRILRYQRKRALTCVTSHTASQLWDSIFRRLAYFGG